MRYSIFALLPVALAAPACPAASKPVYWLLAGDSTTAPGGGWGDAFLSTTVASSSSGHNWAKSGATTKSFRDGGYWNSVIKDIGTYKNDYYVYVTIQVRYSWSSRSEMLIRSSSATTTRKQTPVSTLHNMRRISGPWPRKLRVPVQHQYSSRH
jgi:hypothetical protein